MALNFPGGLIKAIDLLPRKKRTSIHTPNFAGDFRGCANICVILWLGPTAVRTHSSLQNSYIICRSDYKMKMQGALVQKLLRISWQRKQNIKPGVGPFSAWGPAWLRRSHTQAAGSPRPWSSRSDHCTFALSKLSIPRMEFTKCAFESWPPIGLLLSNYLGQGCRDQTLETNKPEILHSKAFAAWGERPVNYTAVMTGISHSCCGNPEGAQFRKGGGRKAPPGPDSGVNTARWEGCEVFYAKGGERGDDALPRPALSVHVLHYAWKFHLWSCFSEMPAESRKHAPSLRHAGVGMGCSFTAGTIETNHGEAAKTARPQKGHVRKFTLGQNATEAQQQPGTLRSDSSGFKSPYLCVAACGLGPQFFHL